MEEEKPIQAYVTQQSIAVMTSKYTLKHIVGMAAMFEVLVDIEDVATAARWLEELRKESRDHGTK